MLSRTADQLYWMARYIERAESMARILDVSYRMALMPEGARELESIWESAIQIAGEPQFFADRYGEPSEENVIRYLALDRDNPSSIWSCVGLARENARALRSSVTSEMWESLNGTWLEMRNIDQARMMARGVTDFFDWVKERSHLVHGVTESTMMQDDSMHFLDLGWYLERADNTARLLDGKYHVILPSVDDVGGAVDYYQWGAVLRAVSAFRAYHKVYKDVITPARVAELLMLRADMPRSLHNCFNRITECLEELSGDHPYECRRMGGEIHAKLHFGRMSEIFQKGLHEFLIEFVDRSLAFGVQVQRDFLMIT
jgi:uncharacterized alpha-E superfamily protein